MNDEECRYLGTSTLSNSCRGSADAFARSLQRRFNSLNIGSGNDETAWYQNGHDRTIDHYHTSPLSPENEVPDPLSNGVIGNHYINSDLFLNTRPIEFNTCDGSSVLYSENFENNTSDFVKEETDRDVSSSDNVVDSSSVDDNYETASDLSADEIDAVLLVVDQNEQTCYTRTPEVPTEDNSKESLDEHPKDTSSLLDQNSEDITSPKIRRCSSLKTGKTPPGTPGGKKIVRFADALGLDLADVKTFVDEIPKIPTSAYNDLDHLDDDVDDLMFMKHCKINDQPRSALVPLFTQPGEKFDFMEKIRRFNVCLESAVLEDPISCLIRGVVRVRNIDFHKTVFVRYSTDRWRNSLDVQASYVNNSCDGYSDKFSFLVYANTLRLGDRLEFAVCFLAKGNEYWDNNNGANYVFECISTQAVSLAKLVCPPSWGQDGWEAAFY